MRFLDWITDNWTSASRWQDLDYLEQFGTLLGVMIVTAMALFAILAVTALMIAFASFFPVTSAIIVSTVAIAALVPVLVNRSKK